MYIEAFRVVSFSSWKDSGWIELAPDFNLFIGLNNSGKSALLRSLAKELPANPHKNEELFRPGDLNIPTVQMRVNIAPTELFDRFSRILTRPTFPAGDAGRSQAGQAVLLDLLNRPDSILKIECQRSPHSEIRPIGGASLADLRS